MKQKCPIRPVADLLVIKRIEMEQMTKSGLFLVHSPEKKLVYGEILAAGPGELKKSGVRSPMENKPGDKVFFGEWPGSDYEYQGVTYTFMRDKDILGTLK